MDTLLLQYLTHPPPPQTTLTTTSNRPRLQRTRIPSSSYAHSTPTTPKTPLPSPSSRTTWSRSSPSLNPDGGTDSAMTPVAGSHPTLSRKSSSRTIPTSIQIQPTRMKWQVLNSHHSTSKSLFPHTRPTLKPIHSLCLLLFLLFLLFTHPTLVLCMLFSPTITLHRRNKHTSNNSHGKDMPSFFLWVAWISYQWTCGYWPHGPWPIGQCNATTEKYQHHQQGWQR